jgi:hypothetical protein
LEPLREAASFPWKQPSRLFVLLQICKRCNSLEGMFKLNAQLPDPPLAAP